MIKNPFLFYLITLGQKYVKLKSKLHLKKQSISSEILEKLQ